MSIFKSKRNVHKTDKDSYIIGFCSFLLLIVALWGGIDNTKYFLFGDRYMARIIGYESYTKKSDSNHRRKIINRAVYEFQDENHRIHHMPSRIGSNSSSEIGKFREIFYLKNKDTVVENSFPFYLMSFVILIFIYVLSSIVLTALFDIFKVKKQVNQLVTKIYILLIPLLALLAIFMFIYIIYRYLFILNSGMNFFHAIISVLIIACIIALVYTYLKTRGIKGLYKRVDKQ